MKTESEIRKESIACKFVIDRLNTEYDNLDQYSMQGREGDQLLEKINKLSGKLEALKWILD